MTLGTTLSKNRSQSMLMFLGVTLHSFVLHNPYVTQLCYGYFYGKWTQFVSRVRCMDLYKIFAQIAGRNPITINLPPPPTNA
jgi:hypothetical protein